MTVDEVLKSIDFKLPIDFDTLPNDKQIQILVNNNKCFWGVEKKGGVNTYLIGLNMGNCVVMVPRKREEISVELSVFYTSSDISLASQEYRMHNYWSDEEQMELSEVQAYYSFVERMILMIGWNSFSKQYRRMNRSYIVII